MTTLTESDNGGSARIGVGETLTIRLSESVGGGYSWAPERLDEGLLELVSIERRTSSGAVGSAVDAAITLRGRRAGAAELALRHWRPWEGESSIVGRFDVRIEVTD